MPYKGKAREGGREGGDVMGLAVAGRGVGSGRPAGKAEQPCGWEGGCGGRGNRVRETDNLGI